MTQHLCGKHDPTCYRCELRRDEYIADLERQSRLLRYLKDLLDAEERGEEPVL